jgi:hypothetical protein
MEKVPWDKVRSMDLSGYSQLGYFIKDVDKYKTGTWEQYFDGLLDPEKNNIFLMKPGIKLPNEKYELWTDSPCLLPQGDIS